MMRVIGHPAGKGQGGSALSMTRSIRRVLRVAIILLLLLGGQAGAAEISGVIFVSETGELDDSFVLRGENVEVSLLRGEVEAEWRRLRAEGWGKVKAQEQRALEARRAWERTPPSGTKDRRAEAMKREEKTYHRMVEEHVRQVEELFKQNTLRQARATTGGIFGFPGVPGGRYLLKARFQILGMGMFHDWLVPVEVKEDDRIEVQLSKKNRALLYAE